MSKRCNNCLQTGTLLRMWGHVFWCIECVSKDDRPEARRAMLRHEFGEAPEGYSAEVLKEIAARPGIMDANELFAPAGKLTLAETKAREAAMIRIESPPNHFAGAEGRW